MSNLKVMPIGGLGEFGMNAMVFQSGNSAILVDCGTQFSDGRNPGLEVIVPDFNYLLDQSIQFEAIILTHGHEDHIGAIPYVLMKRNVPIYGSAFTLELVKSKLKEFNIKKADLHLVEAGTKVEVGAFSVEWVEVTHSIADAFCLVIETPEGVVVHTGDFRIDDHAPDGKRTDLDRLREVQKEKGVLLLCADSTNVEVPGESRSEKEVLESLTKLMDETKGWFVLTTFASHIPRVTEIVRIAQSLGRKVHPVGRSMIGNIGIARKLGYLDFPDDLFVDLKQALRLPRDKVVLLVTGSQAEPRAALQKIARGEMKDIHLTEGDRVVFSSRAIPGHERSIYYLINHIYKTGAEVITSDQARVHVSGHGYREDIRKVIQATKPTYLMPVHGEYKMLVNHKKLGIEENFSQDNILMMENGHRVEFVKGKAKKLEPIENKPKLVDPPFLVDFGSEYLRERKRLSERGMMMIFCVFDRKSGNLLYDPIIQDYGFLVETEKATFSEKIKRIVGKHLDGVDVLKTDYESIEEDIRKVVNHACRQEFDRKPVLFPYIFTI